MSPQAATAPIRPSTIKPPSTLQPNKLCSLPRKVYKSEKINIPTSTMVSSHSSNCCMSSLPAPNRKNSTLTHPLPDFEKFKFAHAQKPYLEFPIMPNGEVYDGESSPGADRIVRPPPHPFPYPLPLPDSPFLIPHPILSHFSMPPPNSHIYPSSSRSKKSNFALEKVH